jgi:hypothetical protein
MRTSIGNRLLDALPSGERDELVALTRIVDLRRDDTTTVQDRPMADVDFPLTALMTVQGLLEDGTVYEVASVGSEAFVEVDAALRCHIALRSAVCQFAGRSARMSLHDFQNWLDRSDAFACLVARAVRARVFVTEQTALCNLRHSIVQRLARWMLVARDRLERSDFDVTHEFVATILGVRRAGVTEAAGQLEREGAIRQQRGTLMVADAKRLALIACECYAVCRDAIAESIEPAQ